jgi:histidyl-tRNA synthetase
VKDSSAIDSLSNIIEVSNELADGRYQVEYDMTLVRGQGYYTGTVFEIQSLDFRSSIAGGGRYDNLIGKFTGESVPAVGFSIGFERIFSVLCQRGELGQKERIALFYDEGQIAEAIRYARTLHDEFDVTLVKKKKKVGKQLAQAEAQGYRYAEFLENPGQRKPLGVKEGE